MLVYSMSVFLNDENLKDALEKLKDNNIPVKVSEEEDQTGEKCKVNCFEVKGLKFVLVKCNDYHKDHDFEIGFTLPEKQLAESFFESLDDSKYDKGVFGNDYMYAIPNDKNIHGPFFFNFDNNKNSSLKEVKSIKAKLLPYDLDFYNTEIKGLIGEEISSKLDFSAGDCFYLEDIIFE